MAASDHLSPQQFYHGTKHVFSRGDMVEPGHPANDDLGVGGDEGKRPYVYVANNPEMAGFFGDRVYRVRPTGPVEVDPELHESGVEPEGFRSSSPFRVLGEHRS